MINARFIRFIPLALLVAGCAASPKTLEKYGDVKLEGNLIKTLSIDGGEVSGGASLPACVASTVRNDSVSLTDASGSFVGPYSRQLYQLGNSREVGGGNVLRYVSADESNVVATGTTQYTSALISYSARFTVTIKRVEGHLNYVYSGIERAQLSTGYLANSGYSRVHIMGGGGAENVLKGLQDLTEELDVCMR